MKDRGKCLRGSLTVEAACVMAMVLLAISVMIRQAGRVHDETVAAMTLHEAVEKGRHGTAQALEPTASKTAGHIGRLMSFPSYDITLEEKNRHIWGRCSGGTWSREIEAEMFRPEIFLRKITLIEGLGEKDGD